MKRILIIEDNPAFLKILKIRLETEGYTVLTAGDGLSGLSAARGEIPDLVITDLMLPSIDGHKVCRLIKRDRTLQHIPVVVLTSRDLDEDAELAKQSHADAFIPKTTRAEIIIDVIDQLLRKEFTYVQRNH